PVVTIKSEFPTIQRSHQQQSLTCLVTVEVAEKKWSLGPDEPLPPLPKNAPPMPPVPQNYDNYNRAASPTLRHQSSNNFEREPQQSREFLESITEDLRLRVENWHGLD